jgi:hypothetical protein
LAHGFQLRPTNESEVMEVINNVCNKPSSGFDGVPCNVIKSCGHLVAKPLAIVINQSFKEGKYPDLIKTSKVVPIHKKGEKDVVSNFRPVAVQSVFSKIFEVIFLRRLIPFLENNDILSDAQYGFRKNKATTDAVFALLTSVFNSIDCSEVIFSLFYDMTKAFDCLHHGILKQKLWRLGIRGKPLSWIMSYLKDRAQVVAVKHMGRDGVVRQYRSEIQQDINTGVPQGSNLGPVLFLLFVNDLPGELHEGRVWLYADDVCQLVADASRVNAIDRTQVAINEMSEWCANNKLVLNQSKTSLLHFYNTKVPDFSPLLRVKDQFIQTKDSVKYLGIHISNNLRWHEHINHISKRLTVVCCLMRRLQNVVDRDVLMKVYYGCFHSVLCYGVIFWGGCSEAHRIFLLQKRIIRIICKAHFIEHCKPLFKQLQVLTLTSVFILESAITVLKFPEVFIRNHQVHQHNTRYKNSVHVNHFRSTLAQSSPHFMASKIYNRLPQEIRNCSDLTKFKKKLKSFLVDKAYYSLEEFLQE